jgi:hypothetical protein
MPAPMETVRGRIAVPLFTFRAMHSKNRSVLKLRGALEDAGWQARQAAMALEEGVIWRGADATRALAQRASGSPLGRAAVRLRSSVERRVAWPLTDELRDRGELARPAVATAAVALALAAATGGALTSRGGDAEVGAQTATAATARTGLAAAYAANADEAERGDSLDGVAPTFGDERGSQQPVPATPRRAPEDPAGRTAWQFAHAFVLYEIGDADRVREQFTRICTPALARSLGESPPRLPANVKVPKARVLNVVIGTRTRERVEASAALLRLDAVSEVRLTLERSKKHGWRVSEVRG